MEKESNKSFLPSTKLTSADQDFPEDEKIFSKLFIFKFTSSALFSPKIVVVTILVKVLLAEAVKNNSGSSISDDAESLSLLVLLVDPLEEPPPKNVGILLTISFTTSFTLFITLSTVFFT